MSSLNKMLSILDLFTIARPVLTFDEMVEQLKFSRPTGYRYIRELSAAGLLARYGRSFSLGPRAIGLDYILRNTDPLLHASDAILSQLRERHGCDLQLLSLMGDRIICVHHVAGDEAVTISYRRGRTMPLMRGSGSKAILSRLPRAMLRKLIKDNPEEVAASVIGHDLGEMLASLQSIRRAGYAISLGELDEQTVGFAAPIVIEESSIFSAIVMMVSRQHFALMNEALVADVIDDAARQILARLHDTAAAKPVPQELAHLAERRSPNGATRKSGTTRTRKRGATGQPSAR